MLLLVKIGLILVCALIIPSFATEHQGIHAVRDQGLVKRGQCIGKPCSGKPKEQEQHQHVQTLQHKQAKDVSRYKPEQKAIVKPSRQQSLPITNVEKSSATKHLGSYSNMIANYGNPPRPMHFHPNYRIANVIKKWNGVRAVEPKNAFEERPLLRKTSTPGTPAERAEANRQTSALYLDSRKALVGDLVVTHQKKVVANLKKKTDNAEIRSLKWAKEATRLGEASQVESGEARRRLLSRYRWAYSISDIFGGQQGDYERQAKSEQEVAQTMLRGGLKPLL